MLTEYRLNAIPLPKQLILAIFNYLEYQDQDSFSLVCRQFFRISHERYINPSPALFNLLNFREDFYKVKNIVESTYYKIREDESTSELYYEKQGQVRMWTGYMYGEEVDQKALLNLLTTIKPDAKIFTIINHILASLILNFFVGREPNICNKIKKYLIPDAPVVLEPGLFIRNINKADSPITLSGINLARNTFYTKIDSEIIFENAILKHVRFADDIKSIKFINSTLEYVSFWKTLLDYDFTNSSLSRCCFNGRIDLSSLRNATIDNCEFSNLNHKPNCKGLEPAYLNNPQAQATTIDLTRRPAMPENFGAYSPLDLINMLLDVLRWR